jgi:hypothetical protein
MRRHCGSRPSYELFNKEQNVNRMHATPLPLLLLNQPRVHPSPLRCLSAGPACSSLTAPACSGQLRSHCPELTDLGAGRRGIQ